MILTFTDYGPGGPYTGQIELVLRTRLPASVPIVHLMDDAPSFDPLAAGVMLGALGPQFPAGAVVLAVVDPGVGGDRLPLVLRAGDHWLVGPDNGLLVECARTLGQVSAWRIDLAAPVQAVSFHGRDLFAPVAADLFLGRMPPSSPLPVENLCGWDSVGDPERVIYVDPYGNLMSGLKADRVRDDAVLIVQACRIPHARVFCEVEPGSLFWYRNSMGLVEIAANLGSAAQLLNAGLGTRFEVLPDGLRPQIGEGDSRA